MRNSAFAPPIFCERCAAAPNAGFLRLAQADGGMAFTGRFSDAEWRVARRLVHTTADFSILPELEFSGGAVEAVSETELCVAETVIVGQVPQAYLEAGQ